MDNVFPDAQQTTKLPSDIRAVSKEKNLFEEKDIKKAGYQLHKKINSASDSLGNLTTWKHPIKDGFLMFIEQPNGFYQFGGYLNTKK